MTRRHVGPHDAQWSWATGEKGTNRVLVFTHPKSGRFYLRWWALEAGRPEPVKRERALGHIDRGRAKVEAEAHAAALRSQGRTSVAPPVGALTLGTLFDMFRHGMEDVNRLRAVHVRSMARFLAWWGARRLVSSLDPHECERYIAVRRAGRLVLDGRTLPAVRDRAIEEELKVLRTIVRWALTRRNAHGARVLTEDPILAWRDVFASCKERNPRRPRFEGGELAAMYRVAGTIDARLPVIMALCEETGHRLASVVALRWSDLDTDQQVIVWRAEHQKNGVRHVTPLTDRLVTILEDYRRWAGGSPEAWLFPNGRDGGPLDRTTCYHWWRRCRQAAALPTGQGRGFHMFRRQFASDFATAPLAMVKALGGWLHPQVVLQAYTAPTTAQSREVLANRRRYAAGRDEPSHPPSHPE